MMTRQVTITNSLGLHARPAGKIAQLMEHFNASVEMRINDESASCDSPLDLLMLQAGKGSMVTLRAEGPEAAKTLDALCELIASGFGED